MFRASIIATVGLCATQTLGAALLIWDSDFPLYDHDPDVPVSCTLWWNTDDGLSCQTALSIAGVPVADLLKLNPSVKSCQDWKTDRSYCLKASATPTPTSPPPIAITPAQTSTTSTAPPTPAEPANGIQTPDPAQPGMVDNCNRFHLVGTDDNCWTLANQYGLTESQVHAWNPEVGGPACDNLWTGYHACIGVLGGQPSPPTTTAPTTPPPSSPNATPQPVQDGMVNNCNRFHRVVPGDNCWAVANQYGITQEQIVQWNTGIGGAACGGMWPDYYLCIGISSSGLPTRPPPAANTPQPVQPGMVAGCKRFHFVTGGQTCETIAPQYGVSIADVIRWNSGAGSDWLAVTEVVGTWSTYGL
ncbi:hypothetical protein PspLS_05917 [Pyricularia sp. CBS 133598]|nr:hypothetical protein PspLS_05917 [Pyricularia sp. CBS 133598]